MKFESSHLIRWGIPGWVFLMWIFVASFGIFDPLTNYFKKVDFLKVAGATVTLITIGVPVGYLFQQIYFSWNWRNKEDILAPLKEVIGDKEHTWTDNFHVNYFFIEYKWYSALLSIEEEKRKYLGERVRHLLTLIHSLGALLYSLATSLVSMIIFLFLTDNYNECFGVVILIIAHIFLLIGVKNNYNYYSSNLIYFQKFFLKEIKDSEKEKINEIQEYKINISFK
jgi:hypothetical protein